MTHMKPKLAKKQLNEVIGKLRRSIQTHGGDLVLMAVEDDTVTVSLTGACRHCPLAEMTFKNAVERTLLEKVRGLKQVILAEPE